MSPTRVLIVDDDLALLQALPEALKLRLDTVTVDTCASASEALGRIAATDYDAIISDIKMPGMDGLALLAQICALRPDTPTLLITGHGEHDLAVQALRGGAYDFIQKPIDRDYFVASLSRAVQLRQLKRRVKELDQLRTQFFTNVSHELRTPLTLVLGPTQKLLAAGQLTDEQRRDLEVVDRNARTLLKHVNDLLDIAKVDAGQMGINYAEVDLARLVRLTAAHFEAVAGERRIAFSVETAPRVLAQADPEKLQRVFLNLFSNAFKFVSDGGRVRCELRVEGDQALVTVEDNGPGVRPELREAIFERFRQGDAGASQRFGTGLGLAIAKEFVGLHRGTIALGDAPGGGACFSVALPLRAPQGTTVAAAADPADGSDVARQQVEALRQSRSEGRRPGHGALAEPAPAEGRPTAPGTLPEPGPPLVLVVEDNEEMNRFIAETLARDYRVAAAFDGQEGLDQALALRPDLIVTDMIMPRLSGDELVRQIRARPELATVPIVVLTAKADEDLRVRLLREGAQDYLTKPFSAQELCARVGNLVMVKRAREVLQKELASQGDDLAALALGVADRRRALQAALDALRESEERARLLVESVKDYAIFRLDPRGRVVSWNAGAEHITGYTTSEILGEPYAHFYPESEARRGAPQHELQQAAAEGRSEADGWRVRRDASSFWANTILTALRDADGRLCGFSTVIRDVTERRRAEQQINASLNEKEILLKELHHRVKNNLQVICSLLNLQSRSIGDRRALELFAATQARVKSMALLHDLLYRSKDLGTIDFADYIRSLTVNLFRSYAPDPETVTLKLDLDPVSLGLDAALPCGLIINELISNALKHAFPAGQPGEIRVTLSAHSGSTYELTISDNGKGLPAESDLAAGASSGLQLVATLIDQLGGALEVQRNGGTQFRLRFPGSPDHATGSPQ
jgi:PAS domain S-box-containing protein